MDINEAITIANVLENPLETPVQIDEMRQVDPTLGKDSISSGIRAAVYGTLLVAIFMAVLLSPLRHHRGHRDGSEPAHFAGGDVFHRHNAHPARHCRHRVDRRHGGGRQRADLRTVARGNGTGQIHARRDLRRLQPGFQHHFRFALHHADFGHYSDLSRHRPGQRLRRDADHRCGAELVHQLGHDPA